MNQDQQQLNDAGRALWNQKAAFWDEMHGDEGNHFHRQLIGPAVERLLAIQPGERVLDIACGSGVLARRLATLGAQVTAVDFSAELIARAQARGGKIAYSVVDATDEAALVALGMFDAITCTMGIMDMPVIAPMYRAVTQMLAPGGRFVFATMHPAFNSNHPVFVAELNDVDGMLLTSYALKLQSYLEMPPQKAAGAPNEPNPHYYYHRPLAQLLGEAFAAGLVLDGLEEPAFLPEDFRPERQLSWTSYSQFPPVIAGRLRVR